MTITEERRLVTVLFVDLVGFTGRTETTDPEVMREVQHRYFEAASAEIERYGGTVEKYIGDAVMAIFGAPRAHDDDAERALHAALGIRDAVRDLGYGLEVRIGVNTGEVVGGSGAGAHAAEYTVTGDAVNVAARLQQATDAGQILVGETTHRLAAGAFDFSPMPQVELKGKADPVHAWRLVRELPSRAVARGGETPLVGRRREMSAIEFALAEAAERGGLLVGVAGEAGIGKSRLGVEARARAEAEGFQAVWASARSYATAFPYYLVSELVELLLDRRGASVLAALEARLPDAEAGTVQRWAAVLDDVLGQAGQHPEALAELTPSGRQHLLVESLRALLAARAAERPQLVVLDDVQWADASSLAVLDEIVELVPNLPLVMLLLYRSGWSHRWAGKAFYQQLNLGGLRADEAGELVRHLTPGQQVEASQSDALLRRAGGNPFFLEELLRAASTERETPGTPLPETIHEVLLARVDTLSADARRSLQVAAVVGMEFSEGALTALVPDLDVRAAVDELQHHDLVVSTTGDVHGRGFAMRHPLVHEVAYRSLLSARRRELHRQAAEWLESQHAEEQLSAVAAHYILSDDPATGRSHLLRAAERAGRLNAQQEALRLYRDAAELYADEPASRAAMLERAATHAYLSGDLNLAIELVSEAIALYERADDRLHSLDCRRSLGRYYWMNGHGKEAEAQIIAAIEGLEQLPPSRELALAYSYRSQIRVLMPDYAVAEPLARRAIEIAEQVNAADAMAHALNNLAMCRLGEGDETGIELMHRSLALALEHNLPDDGGRAYTNLSGQGSAIGFFSYADAERQYEEMLAYDLRTAPGGSYEQWHLAGQAELWIAVGRWDGAEQRLDEMARTLSGNRYLLLDVAAFHALLATYRGRHEEALRRVMPHVEAAVRIEDLQAYAPVFATVAHAERGAGRPLAAVQAIERAIELRGDSTEMNISSWFLFEAVDVLSWLSAPDASTPHDLLERALASVSGFADRLAPLAARGGTPAEVAVRHALFGAATDQLRAIASGAGRARPPADNRFPARRDALVALDEYPRPFDAARIRLWLGEESANPADLAAARTTFEELHAADYAARAGTGR